MLSIILVFLVSLTQAASYFPNICPYGTEAIPYKGGDRVQCYPPCKDGYTLKKDLFNSCWQTCHSVCEGNGKPTNLGPTCWCDGKKQILAKKVYQRPTVPPDCKDYDIQINWKCYTTDLDGQKWIYRLFLLSNKLNGSNINQLLP